MSRKLVWLACAGALLAAVSGQAATLSGKATADDQFTIYLATSIGPQTGSGIVSGTACCTPVSFSGINLVDGLDYYLLVDAVNLTKSPAMFTADLTITGTGFTFSTGTKTLSTDTTHWTSGTTSFASATGTPFDLSSTAIWGSVLISGAKIWAYNANYANGVAGHSYFVSKISSTVSAVPEPTAAALMLAGLAGIGMLSRRRRTAG